MLVIADGATSKLAMQMGYCTEPPKGVCSRAFIEGGTHNVDFDGASLPSVTSLFSANYARPPVWALNTQCSKVLRPSFGKPQTFLCIAGVCFYQRESLPGYSAIFRHPNDELNFCYYLIPCGKDGMCGDVSVSC